MQFFKRVGQKFMSVRNLDVKKIEAGLNTRRIGRCLLYKKSVDSTNDWAKESAEAGDWNEGTVFISDSQTKGRGREGKIWHSPPGQGIYLSILIKPNLEDFYIPWFTLVSGVSVCRSLRKITGLGIQIKFPNDIVFQDKKMGGILTEAKWLGNRVLYGIVGMGINTWKEPPDVPGTSTGWITSVSNELGYQVERETVIAEVLNEFESQYETIFSVGLGPILKEWGKLSNTLGRRVQVDRSGETVCGWAERFNERGDLVVRTESGAYRTVTLAESVRFRS